MVWVSMVYAYRADRAMTALEPAIVPGPARRPLSSRPTIRLARAENVGFLIAGASFLLGAHLIRQFPVMYWGDPYARLENHDHLLVDRWLPLLQALLDGIARVTTSLTAMRLVLCSIGALTVLSGYTLAACLFDPLAAALFAVLLATTPLFVALSIVPYQEVLFLGLAFAGLVLHLRSSGPSGSRWAAVAFNLACLTRYEGWVLVALLAAFEAGRGRFAVRGTLAIGARYGWTALGWILVLLVSHNIGRLTGHHATDHPSPSELLRDNFHQLRGQIGNDLLIVMAAVGAMTALATKQRSRPHAIILSFVLVSLAYDVFADPYSPRNLRQTFLPLVFVLFYASSGLVLVLRRGVNRLSERHPSAILRASVAAAALVFAFVFTPRAVVFVRSSADEPDDRVVFAVAQRIKASADGGRPDGRVVMLSTNELHAAIFATYTGIPRERIVTPAGGRLLADTRYVVDIRLPSAAPAADAVAVRELLESGAIPAEIFRVDSAVAWIIHSPITK
jgi:hypothetical protein